MPSDFAVFYRTHAQSRALEEALLGADLPYAVIGGIRFYDRAEVKDLLAYLRVLANPADEVSLERIINKPTRGIGESTYERVVAARARRERHRVGRDGGHRHARRRRDRAGAAQEARRRSSR